MSTLATRASHLPDGNDAGANEGGLLARLLDALKRSRQAAAAREVRRFVDDGAADAGRPARDGRNPFV